MDKLKNKFRELGITYRDLARRAGTKTQNVQCYFSQARDLGPGPTWVEDAIRGALLDANVPAKEVNELVGSWKQARLLITRGAEMSDKEQTLEQQIAALVKSAWTLSLDVEADKAALKGTITRGLGIDAETRRRAIEKRLDDELSVETAQELQVALWERREQEVRDRMTAAQEARLNTDRLATAMAAAIAGRGDEKLLEECKRLGVNPQDRLNALQDKGVKDAQAAFDKARRELDVFENSPLHPGPWKTRACPAPLLFANGSIDRAALILSKPWSIAEELPELALHVFLLRRQVARIPDMAAHLRDTMRIGPDITYWFVAGWERKDPSQPLLPHIRWAGRLGQSYSLPTMNTPPGGLLFIGDK